MLSDFLNFAVSNAIVDCPVLFSTNIIEVRSVNVDKEFFPIFVEKFAHQESFFEVCLRKSLEQQVYLLVKSAPRNNKKM